jgi:hypothetical protein
LQIISSLLFDDDEGAVDFAMYDANLSVLHTSATTSDQESVTEALNGGAIRYLQLFATVPAFNVETLSTTA